MEVRKTIETEQGTVKFEGQLTQEELDFVLTVGLNELLQQGALPFHYLADKQDVGAINVQSKEQQ